LVQLRSKDVLAFPQSLKNLVLIISDDQDVESLNAMPQLTAQSLVFENAFVTTPVCCVSRASILTGLYAHNHHVRNNTRRGKCGRWPSRRWQRTSLLPAYFPGWDTFYAGKYLNAYRARSRPHGWTHWNGLQVCLNMRIDNPSGQFTLLRLCIVAKQNQAIIWQQFARLPNNCAAANNARVSHQPASAAETISRSDRSTSAAFAFHTRVAGYGRIRQCNGASNRSLE
jgi:hypothetical protein